MSSFTLLKDGSWGVHVQGRGVPGISITVGARRGGVSVVKLKSLVSQGKGYQVWTIEAGSKSPKPSGPQSPSRAESRDYCGFPCPVTGRKCCASNGPCHDCE